jgi:excisionase family DNA binding protein
MEPVSTSLVALRDDRLYTPEDVAEALGVTTWTIMRDIGRSRLRAARRGNTLLIRVSDIAVYCQQNRHVRPVTFG